MKIALNVTKKKIEVGDIVNYRYLGQDYICIVASDDTNSKYPIRLVDLKSGIVVNGYSDVRHALEYSTLLAKQDEVLLTKITKEDN